MISFPSLFDSIIFLGITASRLDHNAFNMAGCLKAAPAYLLRECTAGPTCPLHGKFMTWPLPLYNDSPIGTIQSKPWAQ